MNETLEPLEPLDRRLIHLLADDASRLDEVADEIGCARSEVEARVASLVERGVLIGVTAKVAPAAVGLPVTAYFMVQVAQNAETYETIAALIGDVDQVEEAHAVSGRCDWIVKVRAESLEDVQRLLTFKVALLPGFVRAETLVVLSTAADRVNVQAALYPLTP